MRAINHTGKKFGRLLVIQNVGRATNGPALWNCQCECGKFTVVPSGSLVSGRTQSCGCYGHEQRVRRATTHGMVGTSEYGTWRAILTRCYDPKSDHYTSYGGRGITVCDRWRKFENFYTDMGPRPPRLTLERIDNDLGYFPENCKWATWEEQMANRQSQRRRKIAFLASLSDADLEAELARRRQRT